MLFVEGERRAVNLDQIKIIWRSGKDIVFDDMHVSCGSETRAQEIFNKLIFDYALGEKVFRLKEQTEPN